MPAAQGQRTHSVWTKDKQGLICKYLSQSHCLVCPALQELRVGLDLKQIRDLTIYFGKLLTERAKMDKKEIKA